MDFRLYLRAIDKIFISKTKKTMKTTMKCLKVLWMVLLAGGMTACGSDDGPAGEQPSDGRKPGEEAYIFPELKAKRTEGNIFDGMEFYLSGELPGKLAEHCDSLVWTVEGLEGRTLIHGTTGGTVKTMFSWTHWFQLPGEYDTYLNAYKDGERIYSDTLKVSLGNEKDFLKHNWSEITKSDNGFYGYNNALRPEATLYFLNRYENLTPSVEVMAMSDDHGKNFATVKNLLYTLYGRADLRPQHPYLRPI